MKNTIKWQIKKIADVAKINPPKSEINQLADDLTVSFVPMADVNQYVGRILGIQTKKLGEVRKGYTYFKSRDIIFAKITPCMQNGKTAIASNLVNDIGFGSTEFHVIRPSSEVLPEWIYYILRQQSFRQEAEKHMTGTAGQQRLPKEYLEEFEIPIPSLEEQKDILKILNKVNENLGKVNNIREKMGDLNKETVFAIYKQITEGAPLKTMNEVAPLIRRAVKIDTNKDYPELGIRSFGKGTFHKPPLKGTNVGSKRLYEIHEGDLLFNNVFAWEAAVAVAQKEDHGRFGSHRFITCVSNKEVIKPLYLLFYFLTPEGLRKLGDASPGGAGRNRTLGLKSLGEILVPVPNIEDQLWFEEIYTKFNAVKKLREQNHILQDQLFYSLMQNALL